MATHAGADLLDPKVEVCYCLKAGINKFFLRKMIEGSLGQEMATTVLIVDEVLARLDPSPQAQTHTKIQLC